MNCNFEFIRLYNAPMTLSAIIFQIYEFQVMKRTTFIDVRSNYVHIIVNLWDSDELCIHGDLYIEVSLGQVNCNRTSSKSRVLGLMFVKQISFPARWPVSLISLQFSCSLTKSCICWCKCMCKCFMVPNCSHCILIFKLAQYHVYHYFVKLKVMSRTSSFMLFSLIWHFYMCIFLKYS